MTGDGRDRREAFDSPQRESYVRKAVWATFMRAATERAFISRSGRRGALSAQTGPYPR